MPFAALTSRPAQSFAALLESEPDRPAFHAGAHSATRAELLEQSRHAAAHLSALGFRRGDVLAVWLPDGAAWLQLLFAAAQLGVMMVPISTRYKYEEALHVIQTSRARGMAVATDFLGVDFVGIARRIRSEVPALLHLFEIDTARGFFAPSGAAPTAPAATATSGVPADSLCIFSTSGTTGKPKLAVHDQHGIALHARNVAARADIRPGDVMLCTLSLYGVLGFVQAISALAGGAACVFLPVFDAAATAAAIERHRVTHFFGSDGIFAPVLEVPGHSFETWRFGGLAEFAGIGAAVIERAERAHGVRLIALYGSSECFAVAALRSPDDDVATRSVAGGTPITPEVEFRVIDPGNGQVLGDGQHGELQMRGYNVMSGYLNNPVATAAVLSPDGWFSTGDLAYADGAGFVYLSRLKDSLRLRGYLVDPTEIEAFLCRHPAVAAAQVVGVNRVGEGDIAVAFVRRCADAADEATLTAYCKAGMANYKVPRRIVFVDAFPQTQGPNGAKIQKNKLRELAEALLARS